MKIAGKTVLITGANRGIGKALVEEALQRGVGKIYAATRVPFEHPDKRVTTLTLDITDPAQIRQAAAEIKSLDILVNNAGIANYDDLNDRAMIGKHLDVNLFGTYDLTQAMLPSLVRSGGAVVNIVSIVALAAFPPIPSYSISKAAAFSMTQSMRAIFSGQGVRVYAVLAGPIDTDMNRGLDIPKASPQSAAEKIFEGVEKEVEDIFPDPMSSSMAESWGSLIHKFVPKQ